MNDNNLNEQPEIIVEPDGIPQKPLTFRGAIWCVILFFAINSWSWWYLIPLFFLFPLWGEYLFYLEKQRDWQRHKRWQQQKIKENE